VRGIWSIPVNLPFTTFGKCLAASQRGRRAVAGVLKEKRTKLERGDSSPSDDLMTRMLSEVTAEEEIIDNVMFVMVAAHDTTATLLTFLIQHLDANRDAYARVVAEQEEVARSKAPGDALSWEDLGKMKYTWSAVGGNGDAAVGPARVCQLQEGGRRRGVRRPPDTQGVAGAVCVEHDAVGRYHLPGAR
jgi:hypothetical protein